VKRDLTRPEMMAAILTLLLGFRVVGLTLASRTVRTARLSQQR